ncbi:hypothetical protein, partial [Algibacter sp. Ld11]|uniref:hypothetical protein n=1 Tax=Algibacter sp. Ld11 TaxID=649150 RepID=UPI003864507B
MKSKLQCSNLVKVNLIQARNMMLFLAFFMFSLGSVFAQSLENGDFRATYLTSSASDLVALGASTSNSILVTGKKDPLSQPLANVKITLDLPDGIFYTPNSAIITNIESVSAGNSFVIDDSETVFITDPLVPGYPGSNSPVFTISREVGGVASPNDPWASADKVTFSFDRTSECDAVLFKEAGNSFKDNIANFEYTNSTVAQSMTDGNDLIGGYEFFAAAFTVSINPLPAVNGVVGGVHTRSVSVINGGNAGVSEGRHEVALGANVDNYVLKYGNITLIEDPSSTSTLKVYLYHLDIGGTTANYLVPEAGMTGEDGDGVLSGTEQLDFVESFTLTGCESTNTAHTASWECQESPSVSASVVFGANSPAFTIVQELANTQINNIGQVNHVKLTITNTTTDVAGGATDVLFNLGLGSNTEDTSTTYTENPHRGPEAYGTRSFTNFTIGEGADQMAFTPTPWASDRTGTPPTLNNTWGNTLTISPSITGIPGENRAATFTSDPDGSGGFEDLDGDGAWDDIAPGGSIVIEYDYTPDPTVRMNCGTGVGNFMVHEHVFVNVLTKDQCNAARPTVGRDLGYFNFYRDYADPTIFEQDTDILEGQEFEVAIKPILYGNFYHNNHAMLNSNTDSEFVVSITVPRGVDLVAGYDPAIYTQTINPADPYTEGTIEGEAGSVGTNLITFSTTDLKNLDILTNATGDGFARFPLIMNCAELEAGGVRNTINTSYETKLILTGGTISPLEYDIHCGNFEPIIEHSCNPPCQGPNITGLDAYRITAGWTDASMTTKVDLNSGAYELDKYLAGDEMMVATTGFMSDLTSDNFYFIQTYTTDATNTSNASASVTNGLDDIEFLRGTVKIYKGGVGPAIEVPFDNTFSGGGGLTRSSVASTAGTDKHTLRYDLSFALSAPGVGGLLEDDDTFEVDFVYWFTTETYTDINYHILSGFRGRYQVEETLPASVSGATLDNDNDDDGITGELISCYDWGDSVSYVRPRIYSGVERTTTFQYCNNGDIYLYNDYTQSNSPKLFPGEFRPITMIESVKLEIPDGFRVSRILQQNGNNEVTNTYELADGELTISPALGTAPSVGGIQTYIVTPNRAGGYEDQDEGRSGSWRMRVIGIGSCELGEGVPYPQIVATTTTQALAYADDALKPAKIEKVNIQNLNYTKPTFVLQPLSSPTIIGYGPEAEFDIQVVNTSAAGGDTGYNWIYVPDTANIDITSAEDFTGAPIPLNIIKLNGASYIEIGSLSISETKNIKVKATYDICTDIPVDFSLGWDCESYPNYGDVTSACYDDTLELTLQPALAQIQQSILNQPTAAIDVCDDFVVELNYLSARNGTIVNPRSSVQAFNGSGALTVSLVEVQYPANSGTWETIPLSSVITDQDGYSINIEHSGLVDYGGIPGIGTVGADGDLRGVNVRYTLQTACDFVSNSSLTFLVYGDRTCGEPSIGSGNRSLSSGIQVNGLEATYDAIPTITLPGFLDADGAHIDGCTAQETVNIVTNISEITSATGTEDFGRVDLPTGVTYVSGTFNSISTGVSEITFVSSTDTEIIIQYPAGLGTGDRTEFEFDIVPDAGYCEENASVSFTNYIESSASLACPSVPSGTCSDALISTGSSNESLDINKAAVIINLDSAISSVSFADELITAGFTIDNTSDIEVTAPSTIGAYYDVNKDGLYDTGDLLLGSHQITSAIPGGTSITESIQFVATPEQACNILLVMTVDDNPCICLPASVDMGSPSVISGIGGSDIPVCETLESVELGSANNPSYSYSWAGPTNAEDAYLDNLTVAQPNFTYSGPTLTAITTFTYTVTITRPEGCTSIDTVDVTVNPSPAAPTVGGGELDVCSDEYLSITFGNALGADEVIELWKNAALTTAANAPNTSGNWTSTELFPAGTGNLYATVRNTVTGCRSSVTAIPYTITDCATDLVTVKSVSPATASIGDNVVFTITVSNIGASVDKNVTLSDVLPSDVTFVSDNSSGAYNPVSGLWTIGDIASSGSASIEITATINSQAAGGTVTNTTSAASGDYTDDTLTNGDDLTASVTVNNLVIAAANDNYSGINGFDGDTNLGNILTGTGDDFLNGNPVTTADVAITYPTPATVDGNPITGTAPVISASGDVSVPAGTPAGTYSIPYTICEIGNSSNCSSATVTVVVNAPVIVAVNDDFSSNQVLSADGNTNLGNILIGTGDDTLNGDPTDINEVDITLTSGMFFNDGSGPVAASGTIPEVDPLTGNVSVPVGTPAGTYTINYNICEELNPTNCSTDAVVTILVVEPPVANVDSNSGNTPTQPSTPINILSNDLLGDGITTATVLNTTVDLDPNIAGDQDVLVVPGEGTWNYNTSTGELVFTPETIAGGFGSNYTDDPTPIEYTLTETQTGLSDTATATVDYDAISPTAENDESLANVAGAVTIDPLVANGGGVDADPDGELDPTTVSLVAPTNATSIVTDANGDVTSFAVPNEGTWSVDETTGAITFTPLSTFTEDPTVISYNVEDNDGNQSNNATVTIDYVPVAEDNTSNGNTVGTP